MASKFTVLRDTNEKEGHGWEFNPSKFCTGTVKQNLYTGDYSLAGLYEKNFFVIERKGCISEFAGNLTNKEKWDDFRQELERLEEFTHPFIVLEFNLPVLLSYPLGSGIPKSKWSKMKFRGPYLLKLLMEIQLKYKTKVIFAGAKGKEVAMSLFKRIVEVSGI